ncbi:MAG TPA: c-type cytochrome [Steroidobacteraceae bacterium]|nr:c-type cytochrome [Steroidobacteraceae bacterium]
MTAKLLATVAMVALLGWNGTALAAGNKEAGQAKAATCGACHGLDGNSIANPEWPNLAGQGEAYIVRQLKGFRANLRQNQLMSPMALTVTDQDSEDVAAYFSSQTLHATEETDPAKLAAGQRLFRGGNQASKVPPCSGCHGPTGAGNPAAGYPRIGGQHAAYVAIQLRAYKAGTRQTDPNSMMRTVAGQLSEQEIDAVASYISGLR